MTQNTGTPGRQAIIIPSQVHQERDLILRPKFDAILLGFLLVLSCAARLAHLNYNTLFIDEALYIKVGRALLNGTAPADALTWMSGSYLYPLLAAKVEQFGGVAGLRALSALLSTISAALVYQISLKLFNQQSALWATLLFGVSGIGIFVGQFAVFEALATPLLAGAILLAIQGAESEGKQSQLQLLAASLCFGLAVLTKYVLVLYLPALLLLAGLGLRAGQPAGRRLFALLLPAGVILGVYALANQASLLALLAKDATFERGTAEAIVWGVWHEIGLALALGAVGGALTLVSLARTERPRRSLLLGGLFLLSILALPIYHVLVGNIRSADKHSIYLLLWLAPLGGYACVRLVTALKTYSQHDGGVLDAVAGLAVVVTAVGLFSAAEAQAWGWQHRWPDVSAAVETIANANISGPVLAEGSDIYAYYLPVAEGGPDWQSTWEFTYSGQNGTAAMAAAINDGYFTAVVLDDYYTPGIRASLEPALNASGYHQILAKPQQLSSGETILTTIYLRPIPPAP